jgi:Bacterial membrane protein YfhO
MAIERHEGDLVTETLVKPSENEVRRAPVLRRLAPQVGGLAWVVAAALLTLAPALHHGLSLGPYDILSRSGLTKVPGVTIRNTDSGDQVSEMISWSTQAWSQVHHGHVPLWNPLSGLGLPLAFNWQSAVFSLPALVGYLFPLHLVYTVQIILTLVIAGVGAYVLGRVLGFGVLGCATVGTVYELSGAFMGWLGWPHASVMSWAGWIVAVCILVVRGRHRARHVAELAILIALALYAGEPEIFAILILSVAVFVAILLMAKDVGISRRVRALRTIIDLSLGAVAGFALAAPLVLPGLQVLGRSNRSSGNLFAGTEVSKALPAHDLVHVLVQGYNGLPIAGNEVFGDAVYTDTAAYVGVIAVALAVLGVIRTWRRPETAGFVVLALVTLVIVFLPPLQLLFDHLPLVQTIDWHRDLMVLGLCAAVLAGAGMDVLVRSGDKRTTQFQLAAVLAGGLLVLGLLWLFGAGGLSRLETTLRRDSLTWPLVTSSLALICVLGLAAWTRTKPTRSQRGFPSPGQLTGFALLILETAFLVAGGAQLWSSSTNGATPTPSVTALRKAVGNSTVGFGVFTCYAGPMYSSLGILPEANVLFGVHEFDFYDPILPRAYIESWAEVSRTRPVVPIYNSFCPALQTADQARRYGIGFVLVPSGDPGPTGAVFDERLGGEDLYRIPNSADAVLVPDSGGGTMPPDGATGTLVEVSRPSPSSLRVTTASNRPGLLRLRVTDEPGWHATIDGRPLALEPFAGVMLQAQIPPGHHAVELRYWPTLFTVGLIVAGVCVLSFAAFFLVSWLRRRNRPAPEGASSP